MLEKLESIKVKYLELNDKILDPETLKDSMKLQKLMQKQSYLETIVFKYDEYKAVMEQLKEERQMLEENFEEDFKDMLKEDIKKLSEAQKILDKELTLLLIPDGLNDMKSVIVEIRAGVGGNEAGLFAGDLLRMYLRYAERQKWKIEFLSTNQQGFGCYKEVILLIKGKGVYSKLKYESGVHRVQRIPETESNGRMQTSSATVAVLLEAEDIDVKINTNDVTIDTFRSSGNGGQCVNTTDSAVRLTHLPTGIVISCQDEKSQIENRAKAFMVLRSKLYERYLQEQNDKISSVRKNQVGSGDRSEKIRTYNFAQSRVTDHRINYSSYMLDLFMDGNIDEMIRELATSDNAEKLINVEI